MFCAPAWMMKGGGAAAVESAAAGDSTPYSTRTKVSFSVSNFVFYRNTYIITFKIDASNFSNQYGKVWIEVNRDQTGADVGWHYYDLMISVDLKNIGKEQTFNFSKSINKNQEAKKAIDYTTNDNIYFLFLTDNEICRDQIHPEIKGTSTPDG